MRERQTGSHAEADAARASTSLSETAWVVVGAREPCKAPSIETDNVSEYVRVCSFYCLPPPTGSPLEAGLGFKALDTLRIAYVLWLQKALEDRSGRRQPRNFDWRCLGSLARRRPSRPIRIASPSPSTNRKNGSSNGSIDSTGGYRRRKPRSRSGRVFKVSARFMTRRDLATNPGLLASLEGRRSRHRHR